MSYRYSQEMYTPTLNKRKTIYANSEKELEEKIEFQKQIWEQDLEWKIAKEKEKEQERNARKKELKDKQDFAQTRTDEENKLHSQIANMVRYTDIPSFSFESLRKNTIFTMPEPCKPNSIPILREPKRTDGKYNQSKSLFQRIIPSAAQKYEKENDLLFEKDHLDWETKKAQTERYNIESEREFENQHIDWEKKKTEFYANKEKHNKWVDELIEKFSAGEETAVNMFFSYALKSIIFPISFQTDIETEYHKEEKTIIVDCLLPEIEDIPNIKKVTYLKTQDEYKETYYTEKQIQSEYNNAIYSIVMTYMKVIFALGNTGSLIEFAVVNGIRDTIDRTNGKRIRPYVISVSCKLEDFLQINLEHVDAKAWFKKQKGLSASTFTEITPIAPVVSIATDDECIM